jgi:pyruvate formate lyase activating enzyme
LAIKQGSRVVECELCPKQCRIGHGQRGDCRVRINIEGRLLSVVYARPCSLHIDPVEKKPLFHFLPGTDIFSLATAGCNLKCLNCQNWEISQADPEDIAAYKAGPEEIVAFALREGCPSIAYTYTEPIIYYEYTYDTSLLAHSRGLKNILVTAGYINQKPLKKLCSVVDAANTDLKFFNDAMYRSNCDATLQPVLDALVTMRAMGVWLEVTNLVIPTMNDDPRDIQKMCSWISKNLGPDVPLHFSRFTPRYRLKNLPATPVKTLETAHRIALDAGLKFVYIGNVMGHDAESTYCPSCRRLLIGRQGFWITELNMQDGKCKFCGESIPGVWR